MEKQAVIERMYKFDRILANCIKIICMALLGAIVLLVIISVFTRFIVFTPLNFANPLSQYLMIWMVLLGSGLALREGEHIVVDWFIQKIDDRAKRSLLLVLNFSISIFLILTIYFGTKYAIAGSELSDPIVFNISMTIPYLAIPVSALYMLIQNNLITFLKLKGGKELHEHIGKGGM